MKCIKHYESMICHNVMTTPIFCFHFRISTKIMVPIIDGTAMSTRKHTSSWQYDPWLRQFSTWFTCRATTGENTTREISVLESNVRVNVKLSNQDDETDDTNPYPISFAQSSKSLPSEKGKPNVFQITNVLYYVITNTKLLTYYITFHLLMPILRFETFYNFITNRQPSTNAKETSSTHYRRFLLIQSSLQENNGKHQCRCTRP